MAEIKFLIAQEIYKALERLGADVDLLSVVSSYGDTLSDNEVLSLLKDWNTSGKIIHGIQ